LADGAELAFVHASTFRRTGGDDPPVRRRRVCQRSSRVVPARRERQVGPHRRR
jgi:hypothetical protein